MLVRKGDFFMKKQGSKKLALFGSVKTMTMAAMLTAMSVVIGIFCKNFLDFGAGLFRVTFENLPVILAGIMFGPIVGGIVGAASDIISYLLSNQAYPINLIVTLGAATVGVVSGVFSRFVFRKKGVRRIIFSASTAHIIGSMIIKTAGLYSYYSYAALWRIPLYAVIASLEIAVMCLLYRNSTFRKLIDGGVQE